MDRICLTAVLLIGLIASSANADSLYGTCKYKDGSKANGTVTISTSWNSKKAFPKNGKYVLDFGKKVGSRITIYVNGTRYAKIKVSANTRLDIIVP